LGYSLFSILETFLERNSKKFRLFQKNRKIPFLVMFCQFQPHFMK
jgi:hypothetical protein